MSTPTLFNVETREVKDRSNESATTTDIKLAMSEWIANNFGLWFEVKDGPTWGSGGHLRFDAVAVKKSYTNPEIRIYEIKQSRSDFTGDDKWENYLDYCHKFFFVCPKGLIERDEIPEDVGLIYYSEDYENELHTLSSPTKRNIDLPVFMFMYLVYSRIDSDRYPFYEPEKLFERYVEYRKGEKDLGHILSRELPEYTRELELERNELQTRVESLESRVERYNELREYLSDEHDIHISRFRTKDKFEPLKKALNGEEAE